MPTRAVSPPWHCRIADKAILDLERSWWTEPGPKEVVIRARLGLSAERVTTSFSAPSYPPRRRPLTIPFSSAGCAGRGWCGAGRDSRGASRSSPRAGEARVGSGSHGPEDTLGGSGGRGVLLLAIAVILGVIILQATDNSGGGTADVTTGTEVEEESTSSTASPATTNRALRAPGEVKVLPSNGTQLSGLGSRVGDLLKGGGYINTLSAVDATNNNIETTIVQYTTDFGPEVEVVAAILGLPATVVKPLDNPPVRDTRGCNADDLGAARIIRAAHRHGPAFRRARHDEIFQLPAQRLFRRRTG